MLSHDQVMKLIEVCFDCWIYEDDAGGSIYPCAVHAPLLETSSPPTADTEAPRCLANQPGT